jgi:hypothetical protein
MLLLRHWRKINAQRIQKQMHLYCKNLSSKNQGKYSQEYSCQGNSAKEGGIVIQAEKRTSITLQKWLEWINTLHCKSFIELMLKTCWINVNVLDFIL